jgi:REP element-mobilizing transposase RayT
MPQSLARVLLHLIFSTKHRESLINESLQQDMNAYFVGTLTEIGCVPIRAGGTSDHVHLLLALGRTLSIADLVEELKTGSSKWAKEQGIAAFSWQAGYGVFSVSESKVPEVKRYIERQPEHHRHQTFQEEYREFLVRHGIDFDEQYVWD